ncbi:hypothetical protein [Allocoleopsis sp.]
MEIRRRSLLWLTFYALELDFQRLVLQQANLLKNFASRIWYSNRHNH